jgi:Holliday junction resolvasome RuvABC endonuclease subunit
MRFPSVLGIDPGPDESAAVEVREGIIVSHTNFKNEDIRSLIAMVNPAAIYIEGFQSYGTPLGGPSIKTMYAIGGFVLVCREEKRKYQLVVRPEIKKHLCGTVAANDATVRTALLQRYGKEKAKGITSHLWAALAVASYGADWERIRN